MQCLNIRYAWKVTDKAAQNDFLYLLHLPLICAFRFVFRIAFPGSCVISREINQSPGYVTNSNSSASEYRKIVDPEQNHSSFFPQCAHTVLPNGALRFDTRCVCHSAAQQPTEQNSTDGRKSSVRAVLRHVWLVDNNSLWYSHEIFFFYFLWIEFFFDVCQKITVLKPPPSCLFDLNSGLEIQN